MSMSNSKAKSPEASGGSARSSASMKLEEKLLRRKLKAAARAQDTALLAQFLSSPLVQIIGSVAVTEILEEVGILSPRWAGAVEGGIIAMVGLEALKNYGVIGAGALNLGIASGGIFGSLQGDGSTASKIANAGQILTYLQNPANIAMGLL